VVDDIEIELFEIYSKHKFIHSINFVGESFKIACLGIINFCEAV
jgi:hypothetical protein